MSRAAGWLGLAAALWAGAAMAQTEVRRATDACRLPAWGGTAPAAAHLVARPALDCAPADAGARFEVEFTGFPVEAEAAFQAAVRTWACRIRSGQTIRVAATWAPLGGGTLGSAGPFLYRNFPGAPTRDVWYPSPLADALAGRDLGDGSPDIEALFNSDLEVWHLGPGPPPPGRYDLYTVVLHELGHGLGLIGALEVAGGLGRVGDDPEGPYAYDLHSQDGRGVALLDADAYPSPSVALGQALERAVRYEGRAVRQAVGSSVPLYAPRPWVPGGSYSHLDEDAFEGGTPDGLMTPFIGRGEVVVAPGPATCGMLADLGWALAGDCAARVGPLPERGAGIAIRPTGPNPFSRQTRVRLESGTAAVVRARLVDLLGRVVADYGTFVLVGGTLSEVVVDATGLGAGVYVLTVTGGPSPVALPLTVVR